MKTISKQLLSFMDHLREIQVVHGDIKLENILVEELKGGLHIKIIGFGSAHFGNSPSTSEQVIARGGMKYMAPELLADSNM